MLFLLFFLKKAEIHLAIVSLFDKVRIAFEVVGFAVFQNKDAVWFEKTFQNQFGYDVKLFQLVWRVCKDYVERLSASSQKVESVHSQSYEIVQSELFCSAFLEIYTFWIEFYAGYMLHSSRNKLETYCSRAAKQIQYRHLVKLHSVSLYVEESFACHICGRTNRQAHRGMQSATSQISGNYSHIKIMLKPRNSFAN